uniref:Notchless homolog 1 n=1 Tax=Schistosoma mansoni TaxID=6183 RepID=A0A5K4E8W7_SCHMA
MSYTSIQLPFPGVENALNHLMPIDSTVNTVETSDQSKESSFIQLTDSDGNEVGTPIWIPLDVDRSKLTDLLSDLLQREDAHSLTYDFFVGDVQILDDLKTALIQARSKGTDPSLPKFGSTGLEAVVKVTYQAQAVFRVRPVTRCSSSIPGHKGAVLVAQFSPDGRSLASGSGDQTVRFWDLNTELPLSTGSEVHKAPVLCLAWSPDAVRLASGCQGGMICLWQQTEAGNDWGLCSTNPLIKPQLAATPARSKGRWIRSLSWRPLHLDGECRQLAVAYQDCSIVIWDTYTGQPIHTITGHDKPVVAVRWGGTDLIYSASQDRTIRVWRSKDGVLCRTLNLHGHWVNCLALSTDYVLRTGAFDPACAQLVKTVPILSKDPEAKLKLAETAKSLYEKVKGSNPERLVAGSDDNTLSLWQPGIDKKPLAPRMTGHQGVVNDVKFSPNGRLLASASFDHSVKIWDGFTGFLATMFGHVQDVYLVSWSSDSRLVVSCSKDSTVKVWSVNEVRRWNQESLTVSKEEKKKQIFASDVAGKKRSSSSSSLVHQRKRHLLHDLPGHSDAVYALDWSPDGQYVVSGGKDRILKLWRA